MLRQLGSLSLCAFALAACSAVVSAQSNLTAKASAPQPAAATVADTDRIRDGLAGPRAAHTY